MQSLGGILLLVSIFLGVCSVNGKVVRLPDFIGFTPYARVENDSSFERVKERVLWRWRRIEGG